MEVVNIKKKNLQQNGYSNLEEWLLDENHIYIGRNMSFYVKGANKSKWHNPYSVKKYGLEKCLELYENYIRTSDIYNDIDELNGKVLGCWCSPNKCHGNVLMKLLKELNK